MKTTLLVAIVILCAVAGLAQQNDWVIVPGKRLGPITPDTSRTDLERLLGKGKVRDQPVETGEGPEPGTVVFPDEPDAALAILWEPTLRGDSYYDGRKRIREALICYQH